MSRKYKKVRLLNSNQRLSIVKKPPSLYETVVNENRRLRRENGFLIALVIALILLEVTA